MVLRPVSASRTVFHICVFQVFMLALILDQKSSAAVRWPRRRRGRCFELTLESLSHRGSLARTKPQTPKGVNQKQRRHEQQSSLRIRYHALVLAFFARSSFVFFSVFFFAPSARLETTQPQPEWTERWRSSLLELRVGLHGVGGRCHWHTQNMCVFLSHARINQRIFTISHSAPGCLSAHIPSVFFQQISLRASV